MGELFRRLMAILAIISFCSVSLLSAVSGHEDSSKEKAITLEKSAADESPQVGAEKESANPSVKKRHSALLWILGGLGVSAVVFSVLLLHPKKEIYDLRGKWEAIYQRIEKNDQAQGTLEFSGNNVSGDCLAQLTFTGGIGYIGKGNFIKSNNNFTIHWHSYNIDHIFVMNGEFTSTNSIKGNLLVQDELPGGIFYTLFTCTWTATRVHGDE
jgi:hypothetical protein